MEQERRDHLRESILHKELEEALKVKDYMILRMRVFLRGQPLTDKDDEIEAPYVNIAEQHTYYDCAIYVMKWLEVEVDNFRVEYASLILFDEINQLRDKVIQESEAIRLSKPFAALLSPYCELRSEDINSE
ncbi:hypothetical protein Ahy_B08g091371 [Arachis hypogaea]|uniref:Ubiquitin-like protease family profile domain-containing protein n=1 Tax=Arachis hypogaea TaxID=3818 RepID=A0A444Y209_ARAHY|nr:hypothetical protein Ahy_B08g091371 [Arachis hypogaea]